MDYKETDNEDVKLMKLFILEQELQNPYHRKANKN